MGSGHDVAGAPWSALFAHSYLAPTGLENR